MDLSVITVTWNSEKRIGEQIRSVKNACQKISFEQIIVDNDSTDGTVEQIGSVSSDVILIKAEKNSGFSVANNQAAKRATGEFFLFLNPDMHLEPGSLDTMVAWMREHPRAGIATCRLVDERGNTNDDLRPRRFPGLFDQLALILKLPHIFPGLLNHYLFKDFNPELEQSVDSVRGSFMLMRRAVYEQLGYAFDPRYFIWFEDVDVCREVKRLGFDIIYTPVITCVDYFGQSFRQRDSIWKQKEFTRSMLQYFKKWEPRWKYWALWVARPIGIALAWVNDLLKQ